MDFKDRLKPSDWVSGIGALILLISVFLDWYSVGSGTFKVGGSGWDATKLAIIVLLCSLAAIAIVVLRVVDVDLSAIPVPMAFVVIGLGGLSTLIVILKIIFRPGGFGFHASPAYGIFIALLTSIAVLVGGVLMMREEY